MSTLTPAGQKLLAIALHALCDLAEDGCFAEALKLNRAIATRLELLALAQKD